jgi:hypothetical protein
MTRAILVAVVLSCLVVATQARADFYDGNKLWERCQDPSTQLFCHGYIIGAVDALITKQLAATLYALEGP